jgi:hypothetical protein
MRAAIDAETVFSGLVGRVAGGRSGTLAGEASRCCGGSFDSQLYRALEPMAAW